MSGPVKTSCHCLQTDLARMLSRGGSNKQISTQQSPGRPGRVLVVGSACMLIVGQL